MLPVLDPVGQKITYEGLPEGRVRKIWREGGFVHKVDNERLGEEWLTKMEDILTVWAIPGFVDFIPNGYITRYVEGFDLHGNVPFSYDKPSNQVMITERNRLTVKGVFSQVSKVGERLGFTLGDITCGNLMAAGDNVFLIDYEVIVEWPLPAVYNEVWGNTKRLVGIL